MDAFGDHRCDERHEHQRHGQPVPNEPAVVRCDVIVGRAESGEKKPHEEDAVKPFLTGVDELCTAGFLVQVRQAGDASDREQEIGRDVPEVWNAKPASLVGKVMIGERLRNARDKQTADSQSNRQANNQVRTRSLRDQQFLDSHRSITATMPGAILFPHLESKAESVLSARRARRRDAGRAEAPRECRGQAARCAGGRNGRGGCGPCRWRSPFQWLW